MSATRLVGLVAAVCVAILLVTATIAALAVGIAWVWPDGSPPVVITDPRDGITTTKPWRYCAAGTLNVYDSTVGFNGTWVQYPAAPECAR